MTAFWHNIRPEYNNTELKISKDGESSFETLEFPSGIFDYQDFSEFIQKKIGKTSTGEYGITVLFDLTTFKVFSQLQENYPIDFANSGNFNVLLGFERTSRTASIIFIYEAAY